MLVNQSDCEKFWQNVIGRYRIVPYVKLTRTIFLIPSKMSHNFQQELFAKSDELKALLVNDGRKNEKIKNIGKLLVSEHCSQTLW